MKSIIIYQSMSGNTKRIAHAIQVGMKRAGQQCDMALVKDLDSQDLDGYDLIGLGSYVIELREPVAVRNFIQYTMKSAEGSHAFVFSTHGALPGYFFAGVIPALIQRGLTVIGWQDWFGSVYYPATPKPYFTDGHPDEIDLKEAEDFGSEMVKRSKRIRTGETGLIPVLETGKAYDDIYVPVAPPSRGVSPFDPTAKKVLTAVSNIVLSVDANKCKYPKCTLCIDKCPTGSIDFSSSPPNFSINCERCFHCEQICPNGAIAADYRQFKVAHESVTTDLLEKSLEAFEASGKFRRLVSLKDVGWETPVWVHKKPPRYKPA